MDVRTSRRRACAIAVTAAIAASAVVALGNAAQAKTKKPAPIAGNLTMLVVQGEPFQAAIAGFEAKYPKVHINLQFGPPGPGYGQELVTLIQANNAPDIFYTNPGTGAVQGTGLLGAQGKIVNLGNQPWVSSLIGPAKSLWVYVKHKKTTVWGFPFDVQGVGLTYNATKFAQLGLTPPKTWGQLLNLCGKIRSDGLQPLLISGLSPAMPTMNRAIQDVYEADPHWNSQKGLHKTTFASTPGWVKTMKDMQTLGRVCLAQGWSGLSVPQVFSEMAAGNALMAELPTGATASITSLNNSSSFKSVPFPGNTVKSTVAQAYWTDALSISSASHNKAAAEAFLAYLAQPRVDDAYAKAADTLSLKQAATGKGVPSFMSAFAPYFKSGTVIQRPYDKWAQPGPYLALQLNVTKVILGQESPQAGLKALDDSWGQQTAQP